MSTQEFSWAVNIPFVEQVDWNTLVTNYEDGKEQRRQKWSQPKRTFSISLKGRSDTDIDEIWAFYKAREGSYDTFYFVNPNENPVSGEDVGTGDGTTTSFTLDNFPLPSGEPTAVTVGGSAQVEGVNYTVTRATGVLAFTSVPGPGDAISATYNFARSVRFMDSQLSRELFNYKVYNSEFTFIEVL